MHTAILVIYPSIQCHKIISLFVCDIENIKLSGVCRKGMWGNGCVVPLILNFSTRWRLVVSVTPWLFYMEKKNSHYPMNRMLDGPQSWSGCFGKRRRISCPC